jgi:hypothetical protein
MTPLWRDYFPHKTSYPQRPEPVEQERVGGRIAGLLDETN